MYKFCRTYKILCICDERFLTLVFGFHFINELLVW